MADAAALVTERLVLRRWREEDREPFAAMNADLEVMLWYPAPLSRAESDAFVDRVEACFAEHGWGLWAVEADGHFIGYTGLWPVTPPVPSAGSVEVGWRLARSAWGHGYATEAARAAVRYGFETLNLDEIVSFTAVPNTRSQAVMRRLGMRHDPARDFDHPRVPPGHPIRPHVFYALGRRDHLAHMR